MPLSTISIPFSFSPAFSPFFFFQRKALTATTSLIYFFLLLLGMVAYSLKANPAHPHHIANFLPGEEEKKVILEGTIIKDPKVRGGVAPAAEGAETGNEQKLEERTILILRAERIKGEEEWEKVVGLVRVSVQGKEAPGDYGERIKIVGASLKKPPLPENPREFDFRRFLARKGIYALMYVRHQGQVEILGRGQVNPFAKLALSIKDRMKEVIEDTLEYPQTVLLKGILLGERGGIPEDLKEVFTQTGTVHILAISGLHVGLVVVIFFVLFRAIRIPRKMRAIFTIAVLIAYALITGGRPPVIRASIMAAAVLSGMIVNRESDLLNSLSLAALVILALNPLELFDSRFQLSFAAVLAIISLAPWLNTFFLKDSSSGSTSKNYLIKSFSVILAAQVGVIPLVAYYFSLFTPVALVANFLIVPLLGVVVALGFSTCLAGLISLPLAELLGAANGVVLMVMTGLANFFSRLPLAFTYVGRPRVAAVVGYYLIMGAILYYVAWQHNRNPNIKNQISK
ncbi:ComEC family competence protein [candidate division NPL-UPA2 bacterium]|nr:ComEC family competence protein [candidate division NPL-UPA2 bacterium]